MWKAPLLCTALVLAAAPAATADQIADGRDLAKRWCTGCHIVGPGIPGGAVGLTFEQIVAKPGRNSTTLFEFLLSPHPPMPDLDLTPEESTALTAYMLSLKK